MVNVLQLNMQKSKASAAELHKKVGRAVEDIFMLTEPYIYKNKVCLLPKGYRLYPSNTLDNPPRSAILVKNTIISVFLEHLSTPDCTVVLLKLQQPTLLISGYMASNLPLIQSWLTKALEYATRHNLAVLGCFDSNAHSTLFGPFTDSRGSTLEQFLLDEGLILANDGQDPTYETFRNNSVISSMIDITIYKNLNLYNWRVDRSFNGSDHNTLLFDFSEKPEHIPPKTRKWHKADWPLFTQILSDSYLYFPTIVTPKKLDKMVTSLYTAIDRALDEACPLTDSKVIKPQSYWYTKELKLLSNKVRKQCARAKRSRNDTETLRYRNILHEYKSQCQAARATSWQKFIQSTDSVKQMARLNNILKFKSKHNVNIFEKSDGTFTNPGKESLECLAATHFPEAEPIDHVPYDSTRRVPVDLPGRAFSEWINARLVKKALLGFNQKKSPVPDQLKPIVFQHFPPIIIDYLVLIYQYCIYLHYTPTKWKQARVIFIPKPGKDAYNKTKSFRPISLSNYLLKGLERLVGWKMDQALVLHPIHSKQYGFLKGRSTENAISNTVDYIERALFKKEHCLAVFLDISAAFDSISIHHIKQYLLLHGGDEDLVEWYFEYLARRELHFSFHGDTLHLKTGLGFPQGGVCSAKFWIIAFDPAIQIINKYGIEGNGYADDCSALLSGNRIDRLTNKMQKRLNELTAWGATCNLSFNASKTVAMVFSRSTRVWNRFLTINGTRLPYANEVKYLGITLDKRLHWKAHIQPRIAKAKNLVLKLNSIAWSHWGPRPALMRWAYTGIVRPMLSYGALVWAHEINTNYTSDKLESLQRTALGLCARVPKSTPTSALEIILGVSPLPLFLEQIALKSLYRLHDQLPLEWSGRFHTRKRYNISHRRCWLDRITELHLPQLDLQYDTADALIISPRYQVDLSNFTSRKTPLPSQVNVFTDGSRKDDRTGAGFCIIFEGLTLFEGQYRLPDSATVFQAEVFAIRAALQHLHKLPKEALFVKIHVDSQAVLHALNKDTASSLLTLQVTQLLKNLPPHFYPPTFVWTKAHVGTEGNEEADRLAKLGSELDHITIIPPPKCFLKQRIDQEFLTLWKQKWLHNNEAKHAKHFYRSYDPTKTKYVIKLTRARLGLFIRIVTGHNSLQAHTGKFIEAIFTRCRFCREVKETFVHFVSDCPNLRTLREEFFLDNLPTADSPWSVDKLLAFASSPSILPLLKPEWGTLEEEDEQQPIPHQELPTHLLIPETGDSDIDGSLDSQQDLMDH